MSTLLALRLRNHPEEASLEVAGIRNPTMGVWRIFALLLLTLPAIAVIVIAWIIPLRYHDVRIHHWAVTWTCRLINRVLGIRVHCADRKAIAQHAGLLFANHVSYLDITTIVSIAPLRFLSTAEVFKIPFLGWVADAVSTVFVDRQSHESRKSVRAAIAQAVERSPTPPFVVFPEGRMGTPAQLQPFHRGSFAIAIDTHVAILPVALSYDPAAVATWAGVATEPFLASFWRLVTHRGRVNASVSPLPKVRPVANDDAASLAAATQRQVEDALGLAHSSTSLIEASDPAAEKSE
jgi:1-acyl-sn-glycerol-3-phosphate acyltransferase